MNDDKIEINIDIDLNTIIFNIYYNNDIYILINESYYDIFNYILRIKTNKEISRSRLIGFNSSDDQFLFLRYNGDGELQLLLHKSTVISDYSTDVVVFPEELANEIFNKLNELIILYQERR